MSGAELPIPPHVYVAWHGMALHKQKPGILQLCYLFIVTTFAFHVSRMWLGVVMCNTVTTT